MTQFNTIKKLMVCALLGLSGAVNGQGISYHPLAFGSVASGFPNNWYYDYVGERFMVTAPISVAGEKVFTTSNDGSGGTGVWGGVPTGALAITNTPLILPQTGDSLANVPITVSMAGKVALIWRGTNEFGAKALAAQTAGAAGCVIINNKDGGPVGMAAGASGASVTIPVFMISKTDGNALYTLLLDGTVPTLTVCFWGQGNLDDLGFVSRGTSLYHNGAIPFRQLNAAPGSVPYWAMDGAFIANFGSNTETNVKLAAYTTFTPTGGSATTINGDSVTLASFPQTDSIWALYMNPYTLTGITTGGTVQVDYTLSSNATDQFLGDNYASYTFNVTDNVFCKGRYDMVNNRPYVSYYTGAAANSTGSYEPYIWGPTFYVAHTTHAQAVQYTLVQGTSSGVTPVMTGVLNTYVFKWVDGFDFGAGAMLDSFIENGELELVGTAIKTFGATDSSWQYYTVMITDSNGTAGSNVSLDSNNWYYVAAEMEQTGATTNWALGCDGINTGYIRTLGRDLNAPGFGYPEYFAPLWTGGDRSSTGTLPMWSSLNSALGFAPFGGSGRLDSVIFSTQKGLIPNIALTTSEYPVAVNNTKATAFELQIFPNPAKDYINVTVGFESNVKEVSYTILSTSGKVVGKETHQNVTNETYTCNTSKLPSGTYFVVIAADGKSMFRKFAVVR